MLTASQVYTYTRRILDAYTVVMQPLSAELDMAPNAVDILLFLANNPGLDTARSSSRRCPRASRPTRSRRSSAA